MSAGGTDELDNLVTLCDSCHAEWHAIEGAYSFTEWLHRPPLLMLLAFWDAVEKTDNNLTLKEGLALLERCNNSAKTRATVDKPPDDRRSLRLTRRPAT